MEMISIARLMMTLIAMKMETVMALRIIVGSGVVPRMAPPPPPKGVQRKGIEREREREREL